MRRFVVDAPRTTALRALNYAPSIERIRRVGSSSARPLREIVGSFGPAYAAVFTRRDCDSEHGVELITQGDMFAAEPSGRVIRLDSMQHPTRHRVTRGQVLIAGAGTLGENELFGRSIIADDRLVGKYVGPHSMSLHFEAPDDDFSLFAYAWLASTTGVEAIRSTSYGTKILGLRKDLLSSLPVPEAPTEIVGRVASLVRKCMRSREEYATFIRASRREIESCAEVRSAGEACRQRTRRSVIWNGPFSTLGAWNYAGAGAALAVLKRSCKTNLRDYLTDLGIHYGSRSVRIPCRPPFGVDFVAQRDAFLIRPIPRRMILPDASADQLLSPIGSLMLAGRGTLGEGEIFGRCVQIAGPLVGLAFTGDMMRVSVSAEHSAFLYAYLTTHLGVQLVRTAAVGTKILQIRSDLLESLPVPDVAEATRRRISELVSKANDARTLAEKAESEAVRIIENEVLPAWLA